MHSRCVVCLNTNLQSYRGWGGGQGYEGFMKNRLGQITVYLKCVAYTAFLYLSEVHLEVLSDTYGLRAYNTSSQWESWFQIFYK